jgi:hypothetical protein
MTHGATSPCQLVLGAIAVGASSFLTAITDAGALDAYQNAIRAADVARPRQLRPERCSPVRRRTKLTSPISWRQYGASPYGLAGGSPGSQRVVIIERRFGRSPS